MSIPRVEIEEMKWIGMATRTNTVNEMDPQKGKILATVHHFIARQDEIPNRLTPSVVYGVYTDYASDLHGDYTYFIGQAVSSFDDIPDGFTPLTRQSGAYAKLSNGPGEMPAVCIDLWQRIWQMTPEDLGGSRCYRTDFERDDERALDPSNTTLDIYVGLEA